MRAQSSAYPKPPSPRRADLVRELALVRALDEARDASRGMRDLLSRCASVLQHSVAAEGCALWLDGEAVPPWLEERDLRAALARREPLTGGSDGAYWLITPLRRGERAIGAIALVDSNAPFDGDERRLVRAAVAQTDSALAHALDHHELRRRRRELETIHRIDRIRDSSAPFGDKLDAICAQLGDLLGAEVGFVMLFDLAGRELERHAVTHRGRSSRNQTREAGRAAHAAQSDPTNDPDFHALAHRLARDTANAGRLTRTDDLPAPWLGYAGVPLLLREEIIGVFGAVRGAENPAFDDEDEALLQAVAEQMDTAIFENREKLRVREMFGRYVHPHVVTQLIERAGGAGRAGGMGGTDIQAEDVLCPRRDTLTVLFSDIRGFTAMSESRDAQFVVALLDEHLDAMAEVVLDGGGTVDKFVGDEVMAIFGAPLPMASHKQQALQAVRVAQAMQRRQIALAKEWEARGWPSLEIGIGINIGPMMVGNIGSERMSNYTVIGSAVNLGARLCGAAGGGQILLSCDAAALVDGEVPLLALEPLSLKGIPEPVSVFEVAGE